MSYKRGQGSIVLRVKILDSTATTGAGKTGLTSASAGLIISTIADNEATATAYTVTGSTIETITTLGTFAAPTATKCRFKEVDSTNHKGVYEIQIADARFAVSSAKSLLVSISGATGAAETDAVIPLTDIDPYDTVRAGLTALPNAAANADGGLPVLSSSGTTLAYTISTLTTYTGNTPQTGDSFARIGETGSGLTSLAPASTALSTVTWTATRAGYIDNLSGGAVALNSGVYLANGAHGGASATIVLKSVNVSNSTGDAVTISSTGSDGHAIYVTGNGGGDGFHIVGGSTGHGLHLQGGSTSGDGLHTVAQTSGDGIQATGAGAGVDINGTLSAVTTVTNQLTAAQIATGVWTDTTASDFTAPLSVGKSVMNGVTLGTGLTIARCTLTDTITTYTGNTPQTGNTYSYLETNMGLLGANLTAADTEVLAAIAGIGTAGGAAVNVDASTDNSAGGISGVTSGTTKVGTETGTYINTSNVNGVYHVITGTATALDWVYGFSIGGGTSPVQVRWTGYLSGNNDTATIYAWNHTGGVWESLSTIIGQSGTTNILKDLTLYARHSGTSEAELGKVYIRFACTGMTTPILNTDQLVVSYAVTSRSVGYANGAVWIDTLTGTAGTESFVNGTADHASLTLADAITIATNIGLRNFEIGNGSTITLTTTTSNKVFYGHEWILALGGQDITSSMFIDAIISGTGTGLDAEFQTCTIGTVTLSPCFFWGCIFASTMTIGEAGDYFFIDCASAVAGSSTPVFDLGAAVGSVNMSFRRWSGGASFINIKTGDIISMDVVSGGTITVNGTGGSISIRGICNVVDSSAGAVTITQTSVLNSTTLATPTNITAGTITTVGTTTNLTNLPTMPVDWITASGLKEDAVIEIQSGLSTFNVSIDTVLANVKEINSSTAAATKLGAVYDAFESGTAQAGGASSITLANTASSVDDYFKNQAVFLLGGTGAKQTNRITAYNGTTKVATVETPWVTVPDNTTPYFILGRIG